MGMGMYTYVDTHRGVCAFAPTVGLGLPKGMGIDWLSGVGASAGISARPRGFVLHPLSGSAVWQQC